MSKRAVLRAFCDHIRDELFESIHGASCLRRHEKSVLLYLWSRCKTRKMASESYPGHESAGATLGISPLAVHAAIISLERKGFIKAFAVGSRRKKTGFLLNAFVLECAYDKVRLKKTS